MKRIVYNDPLAAAWMAKAHGVRFGARDRFGKEFDAPLPMLNSCIAHWAASGIEYLFVHPDSLALYEPRVGDVVSDGSRNFYELHNERDVADAIYDKEKWDAEIIQRDGKAWINGETQ